ncbi:MAG: hypothetical protein K0S79_2659 [Nitrospira sp.]|nr:hypothetical protein [Nitrospira sp.]
MEETPLQELKQGFRNRIRTLNREVVPSANHNAARHKSAEFLSVSRWVLRRGAKTAIRPSQDDGRHPYRRAFCQLALYFHISLFTWRIQVTVTIGMQDNLNEVGIIEGGG